MLNSARPTHGACRATAQGCTTGAGALGPSAAKLVLGAMLPAMTALGAGHGGPSVEPGDDNQSLHDADSDRGRPRDPGGRVAPAVGVFQFGGVAQVGERIAQLVRVRTGGSWGASTQT